MVETINFGQLLEVASLSGDDWALVTLADGVSYRIKVSNFLAGMSVAYARNLADLAGQNVSSAQNVRQHLDTPHADPFALVTHSGIFGNGGHIPTGGLSHTALIDKGTKSHATIETDLAAGVSRMDVHVLGQTVSHATIEGVLSGHSNSLALAAAHASNDGLHVSAPVWSNLTVVNGWVSLAGYGVPQICKDKLGFVHLRGAVNGSAATGTTIATLPVGYRPSATLLFSGVYPINNFYVTINNAGVVAVNTVCTWISLDSIPPFSGA